MHLIGSDKTWPLHGVDTSRQIERLAAAGLAPHTLMQRAGLGVARLARAVAPHARHVWIACGPGNNGGDGFEAAMHLHRQGLKVSLTAIGAEHEPPDAQASRLRALQAGVRISQEPPDQFDLAIDALLGLGAAIDRQRPAAATLLGWLSRMHQSDSPVLAVDLPSGLNADTGSGLPGRRSRRTHTLSLLTLKPGLFTGQGRDQAGTIWFDPLGIGDGLVPADAQLIGSDGLPSISKAQGPHDSHKGRYGDVLVVGGTTTGITMVGAAVLAARAALRAGAGRVYLSPLGPTPMSLDPTQPELMWRPVPDRHSMDPAWTIVCGCGGGQAVAAVLPVVLDCPGPLVLDADALNAIATEPALRRQLCRRGRSTVITPHPLEAARLLQCTADQVQSDRVHAARTLSAELDCTVVLKGSGTVVASKDAVPGINPNGNPLLATAGTGDVLAGFIGAALARGLSPDAAARLSVHHHGTLADGWAASGHRSSMVASDLLRAGDSSD
jgi:hydroxyethylthiazole kinase-like uncharacterized protein yjeF